MTHPDARQLAKDVAKNLDKRRRRRKLVILAIVIAAIVAAVLYLGFGRGWGFGKGKGKGEGEGPGSGSAAASADNGALTCKVRVTAEGVSVDGKMGKTIEVVDACRARGAAEVVVTGDARQGAWDELKAAFEAAEIAFYVKNAGGSAAHPGSGSGPGPGSGP